MVEKKPTPEELAQIVAEDKRQREQEFMQMMNKATQHFRVNVFATIESHGVTAVARLVVKAE